MTGLMRCCFLQLDLQCQIKDVACCHLFEGKRPIVIHGRLVHTIRVANLLRVQGLRPCHLSPESNIYVPVHEASLAFLDTSSSQALL